MKKMIFFILFFLGVSPVWAGLGNSAADLVRDRQALGQATLKSTSSHALYTVSELESDGTTIREYISNDGVVFAVTWQGLRHPDLSVLLGSYYSSYQSAKAKKIRNAGHQPSEVQSQSLTVRHAGHMRDLRGKAFVSDLIPAGVDVEDLQ